MSQQVKVRLMGKAAELANAHEVAVTTTATTPKSVLSELAKGNPLLADSLIRGDGTPRSSTRVLINGKPPASLDDQFQAGADVIVALSIPCDG